MLIIRELGYDIWEFFKLKSKIFNKYETLANKKIVQRNILLLEWSQKANFSMKTLNVKDISLKSRK